MVTLLGNTIPLGNSVDKVLLSVKFGTDHHLCKLKCEDSLVLSPLDLFRSDPLQKYSVRTVLLSLTKSDKIIVQQVMEVWQFLSDLNYFVNIDLFKQ